MPVACEHHGLLLAVHHVTTVLVTLSLVVEGHATAAKCKQFGWEFLSMRKGLVVERFAHQPLLHPYVLQELLNFNSLTLALVGLS